MDQAEAQSKAWLGRIPPVTDTKMITAWNGLMISGLARAYQVLGEQQYLERAIACGEFIEQHQRSTMGFCRLNYDGEPTITAQGEDYVLTIKAWLDLYQCNLESQWLDRAISLQQEFDRQLWSESKKAYRDAIKTKDLLLEEYNCKDNATPSTNGIAASNLVRLGLITQNSIYYHRAEKVLKTFSTVLVESPRSCPSLVMALGWYLYGQAVSIGPNSPYLKPLQQLYSPVTVWKLDSNLTPTNKAIVCTHKSCLEPVHTWEELLGQLKVIPKATD
jgi:uncharacterized protein YyaL (SSP411 family)